ncbi:MAG: PfkB family carbohydrate kinase, partial [Opitutaceae bacterium]|nr:PfkB family carbohydrate kinase [Opitutaceae bacterium]
ARRASFQVGGKGVNVSKMLARLGAPTTALCFAGGAPGDECAAWLRASGIGHRVFPTSAVTRAGTVIRAPGQPETTFLGPDAPPDADALAACAAWLDEERLKAETNQRHEAAGIASALQPFSPSALPSRPALALCGSFPGWDAPAAAPLRAALSRWAEAGRLFVDAYGPPLAWAVGQPAALIKINRDELIQLASDGEERPKAEGLNAEKNLRNDAARVASAFQPFSPSALPPARPTSELLADARRRHPAVRRWIISDGPREVWFAEAGDAPPAMLRPPPVREVSATGSGDVLFACVLHNLLIKHEKSLANALVFALPYSAANAASLGVADFDLNQLPNQLSDLTP